MNAIEGPLFSRVYDYDGARAVLTIERFKPEIERNARIDELQRLLDDWPNLCTDTIRERIAELEAERK